MAIGYFLRVGDRATCGKHLGTYNIIGGVDSVWNNGRKVAGTLESISSCPCHARFISSINDCYIVESNKAQSPTLPKISHQKRHESSGAMHSIHYLCKDDSGRAITHCKYYFYLSDGEYVYGETDNDGYTLPYESSRLVNAVIHIIK
ncbi:hypothetical protein [Proteus vulgaris]|uniref:PAAR domain-containing protein n=1 Tax=Proteus vulgaris TaxID=585 RepID=A0A6G6SE21_PROVU|nr:hypothetical protein [Proteus vulgaris]QIF92677.1 PAAR domain-containing protein [Proteus vulgaris]CRL62802.1 hypothetical protein BN1805_01960 [Proteus vulgaris]